MSERIEAWDSINASFTVLARSFLTDLTNSTFGGFPLLGAWRSYRIPGRDGLHLVGFQILDDGGAIEIVLRYDADWLRKYLPMSYNDFRGLRLTMPALLDGIGGNMELYEKSFKGEDAYAYISPIDKDEDVKAASEKLEQLVLTMRFEALGDDPLAPNI
jgi:hypothetical protein